MQNNFCCKPEHACDMGHTACCPPCNAPCPCPPPSEAAIDFYAQYRAFSALPSGSLLLLRPVFQHDDRIRLEGDDTIVLTRGCLYLVNYVFLATLEPNSYMEVVPKIDDSLRLLYAFFAPTGSASRNTSASGSFTTNEAAERDIRLSFSLTYPSEVSPVDLSGAVSVTPLMKIG